MIEVRWDYQGGDRGRAVQTAVEKVVRRLHRTLGAIVCPHHGCSPALRVRGHMFAAPYIGFATCCQSLMNETTARVKDIRRNRQKAEGENRRTFTGPERRH